MSFLCDCKSFMAVNPQFIASPLNTSYRPVCPRHFVLNESYNVEWKLLEFG